MSWVVRLIVVLPALAGLVGLLTRRSVVTARLLAVGTATVVAGLALAQWIAPADRADIATLGALPLHGLGVPLHLLSDPMSALVALAVALVVLAIQIFTVWYHRSD
ncbi:MAG: NADH-quinone oxidoreductase subunit L, partial [Dermatophilaceae bacterium]